MKLTWMQCRLLLLELVQPQSLEDLLKEDPNLSTAAEISNAPNFDSVEVRPTRPSKPPQLIAEGITNVIGLLEALNDVTPPDSLQGNSEIVHG
ncbi:GH24988 [Drosophila grimshawi]|uniref:GH24988 n=1 Tax=Drosophila grimshawi TaxID=7222 RepID=B4K2T3_DROGR|nr:GH24988 [Drosophila grimshawi]